MIYDYEINGLPVKTGDLLCTSDGDWGSILGVFWRVVGAFIPGKVDHIAVYVGPRGRCVEAGMQGRVSTFEIPGGCWEARRMVAERGRLIDVLHGVAYPLQGRSIPDTDVIRRRVASYCLEQARLEKPYNINFFNSGTEKAFYCSQLAYKAYLREGINLHSGKGIPLIPGTGRIVLPQEIWDGCTHREV
ncbi:MAG: hypothetical protein WA133_08545 [Syntrophales bacterium]